MEQKIFTQAGGGAALAEWFAEQGSRRLMLVCGSSAAELPGFPRLLEELSSRGVEILGFHDFCPNPAYGSAAKGAALFRDAGCDAIMAVGGGSAMDVAKCIKLWSRMPEGENYLLQKQLDNDIPFAAMPTTAGTGSEATRSAVIYFGGEKHSVASGGMLPGAVLLDPEALSTLPLYQRKATMLDALCHALESLWAVSSTEESRAFAGEAIRQVLESMDGYLGNTPAGNAGMLRAAHTAGKAINITKTTAGHAMCYKITTLFHAAHGHAAALCDRVLFPWMLENIARCTDPRGEEQLRRAFGQIAGAMGCGSPQEAAEKFRELFDALALEVPAATGAQLALLTETVNTERLQNHPIAMDRADIGMLYRRILREARDEG